MRWTSWQLEAEPSESRDLLAWQVYVDALGAGDLQEHEAQIRILTTPEPKNEGERNRQRQAEVKRLREHVAALRKEIYPVDEPDAAAGSSQPTGAG